MELEKDEGQMTLEDIQKEITEIAEFCSCYYHKDNGIEMTERLTNLNVYLARSAVLLSEAQFLMDNKFAAETERLIGNELLTPSIITNLGKARCSTENKLYKLVERINRTITHQIEGIRTQISYLKSFNN